MILSSLGSRIQNAIAFAIKTHEIDQQQKRKGKNVPYITHPLTVGLILSRVSARDEVIAAGILHDTIEDSKIPNKVSKETLVEQFGENIAALVESVSEPNKDLSWDERKAEALERIKTFSQDALLLKSADIISNISEVLEDYKKDGENTFARFNAPKDKILHHTRKSIAAILERWSENPLKKDLLELDVELYRIEALDSGFISYLVWNMFYIQYEIDRVFANSYGANRAVDLCVETQDVIQAFLDEKEKDIPAFDRNFYQKMKEFDVVIRSIKENDGENMLYFLLISHIADCLNTMSSFADTGADSRA